MLDPKVIKKDFPIFKREINGKPIIYLDSAATSQKPKQVIDSITDYYSNHNANIHRGIYVLSEEATKLYENAKVDVARFINAKSWEEIVFVKNTTEGLNLIANSFSESYLKKGDNIVISLMEHHSNIVPWQILSSKIGFNIIYLKVNKNFELDLDELENILKQNKVKLVSVTHISNVLGTINDVKAISSLAHKYNSLVMIDGAQSIPHIPVDVQEIDCDFLVFSGHKMLAPMGSGVLYGKGSLLNKLPPFLAGGDMIEEVTLEGSIYKEIPYKFEAGTPNVEGAVGLSSAIKYLENIGMDNVAEYEREITKYALNALQKIPDIKIYGPPELSNRSGVISFTLKNIHPHDVAQILDYEGISVRAGFHCAMPLHRSIGAEVTTRASFYIYTLKEDIDELVKGVEKAIKTFS